jgi:DNA invertase Pin-like site-specific DNA recombinase
MYLRVSTASKSGHGDARAYDQNPEVQEQPLRELIAQRGWQLEKVYSDRASGAQEHRPGLSSLMADARRGGFDVVVVWRFDRFARSVKQTRAGVGRVSGAGYRLRIAPGGSGHSTPMGKGMFTIIAAMAELERSIIRERVTAGMDHARRNGTRSGKAIGRPRAIFREDLVPELHQSGLSWRVKAKQLGVSATTVRRAYKKWLTRVGPRLENSSAETQDRRSARFKSGIATPEMTHRSSSPRTSSM